MEIVIKSFLKIFAVSFKRLKVLLTLFIFLSLLTSTVHAQFQEEEFSGNKKESYQCFGEGGRKLEVSDVKLNGYWLCMCEDGSSPGANGRCGGSTTCPPTGRPGTTGCFAVQSVLKPPTFQQLEIWFVRLIYVAWSLVGTLSFFFLIVLGYRYTISRGDSTKITEIRQKIIYYIVGLALVFLAVPILTTVFRVMGINRNVECYNVNMPGFQFFFTELCTDPNGAVSGEVVADPCSVTNATGKTCNLGTGTSKVCPTGRVDGGGASICYLYECSANTSGSNSVGVWNRVEDACGRL
jgi:hypothetical protein